MWTMGGYRVKYETPQIKDFGSIVEHTFQLFVCDPNHSDLVDGCHHS